MYELIDVIDYMKERDLLVIDENRVELLYTGIENPSAHVKTRDELYIAYETDASENTTAVNAILKIANDMADSVITKDMIKDCVDEIGILFEEKSIKMKPRIPFYILVLSKIFH
ncbi:MAG: hypothetical protein WA945_08175 [Arcobacteraceae bacterium]